MEHTIIFVTKKEGKVLIKRQHYTAFAKPSLANPE